LSDPKNRRLVGFAMLAGAVVMGLLALLFRTEVIADAGGSRAAISLVLGGIAAVDAVIGGVLIAKS
jgi:hypothetical protein